MSLRVGQMVKAFVWVGHERRPVNRGRIVAVHSGYCDIDVCYPFGEPWILSYNNTALEPVEPTPNEEGR